MINIDSIVYLIELFRKDSFDEKTYKKLIKTPGMKGFVDHIGTKGKRANIREELQKVLTYNSYKDDFGFYLVRDKLPQLKNDMEFIIENEKSIVEEAIDRVYKIIPQYMKLKFKIFLYFGGQDGGFIISGNNIYINYKLYIDNLEELIKIISHELYHCRSIAYKYKICFFIQAFLRPYGDINKVMGRIFEEGLASLTQHGKSLKVDDPAATLTSRGLVLIRNEFRLLNQIILAIKDREPYTSKLKKLNPYTIGYHIVSTVYNTDGVLILDKWTTELKYKEILKRYMEICSHKGVATGFNQKVESLILKD